MKLQLLCKDHEWEVLQQMQDTPPFFFPRYCTMIVKHVQFFSYVDNLKSLFVCLFVPDMLINHELAPWFSNCNAV